MKYTRVEGHWGYVKDENGAVLNMNKEEIEAARKRKAQRLSQEKEISELKNEVSDIKKSIVKLKDKGFKILGDGIPREGAHGKPVVFLHPKQLTGTLIELEEV